MVNEFHYSERQACKLMSLDRTSYRYRPDHNVEFAGEVDRAGPAEAAVWLPPFVRAAGTCGQAASPQRVYRIYRAEHLAARRLKRKHLVRPTPETISLSRPNQEWAMDFVADGLATGRGLRMLTVVDSFTREYPAIEVDTGLSSRRVTRALEWIISQRGKPEVLRCDNVLNASTIFEF